MCPTASISYIPWIINVLSIFESSEIRLLYLSWTPSKLICSWLVSRSKTLILFLPLEHHTSRLEGLSSIQRYGAKQDNILGKKGPYRLFWECSEVRYPFWSQLWIAWTLLGLDLEESALLVSFEKKLINFICCKIIKLLSFLEFN